MHALHFKIPERDVRCGCEQGLLPLWRAAFHCFSSGNLVLIWIVCTNLRFGGIFAFGLNERDRSLAHSFASGIGDSSLVEVEVYLVITVLRFRDSTFIANARVSAARGAHLERAHGARSRLLVHLDMLILLRRQECVARAFKLVEARVALADHFGARAQLRIRSGGL